MKSDQKDTWDEIRQKINTWDEFRLKNFCTAKKITNQMKRQLSE